MVGADITEFRRSMQQIRNETGILSETIGGIGKGARMMTFALTTPLVALGTYAVQAASGFDASMRNINSILNLSEDKFKSLSDEAMSFAQTTRAGVVPATQALYEIFSAGIMDQDRAMAVWKASNLVAEAGVADLTKTTNAMTGTMTAYGLATDKAAYVGNIWTRMVQVGVGSLDQFLSNQSKVLSSSKNLGVSLEDMGATIAFLSQVTGNAGKAETVYSQVLNNMLKPTTAMIEAFGKLKVASGDELIKKFGSVGAAVQALNKVSDKETFGKMFNKSALEGALLMVNNMDGLSKAVAAFNDGLDTATMDAWNQQSKSFAFQWDKMKTSLEAVAVTIGQIIIPIITPVVNGFSALLQGITKLSPEVQTLGVMFLGVVAIAPPLVWLLTSLLNPIGLIAGGLAALSAAVYTNFNGIQTTIKNAVASIFGDLTPLKSALDTFMETMFPKASPTENIAPVEVNASKVVTLKADKVMSLWDLYKSSDLEGVVNWNDFMKLATKGGWEGGALKAGEMITIEGLEGKAAEAGTVVRNGFKAGYGNYSIWEDKDPAAPPPSLFERLAAAISAAWPKVQTAVSGLWDKLVNWFKTVALPKLDDLGSSITSSIDGWFDTSNSDFSGKTQVYDAVKGMMTTNYGGAINDSASEVGKNFEAMFPKMAASLRSLFDSVGKWIEAEAVPTLARSVGVVAGTVVRLLGSALNGAWDMLSGGNPDAAKQANAVNTMVIDPLREGLKDGIAGADGTVDPWADLFRKFSDSIYNKGEEVKKDFKEFADGLLEPLFVGLRVLRRTFENTLNELQLKVNAAALIIDPNNAALLQKGQEAGNAYLGSQMAESFEKGVNDYMNGYVMKIDDSRILPILTGADPNPLAVDAFVRNITDPFKLQQAVNKAVSSNDQVAMNLLLPVVIGLEAAENPKDTTLMQMTRLMDELGLKPDQVAAFMTTYYRDNPVKVAEIEAGLDYLNVTTGKDTKVTLNTDNLVPKSTEPVNTKVDVNVDPTVLSTPEQLKNASDIWGKTVVDSLPQSVVTAMANNGGDMTAAADSLVKPIGDAFTTAFAPETGTVSGIWASFLSKFMVDLTTLQTDAETKMPKIKNAMVAAFDSAAKAAMGARDGVKGLLGDLNALSGISVTFTVSSQPSGGTTPASPSTTVPVNGSHAGGLANVPFDGYIAQLHAGEAVLTKNEASAYRSNAALPSGKSSVNVDNSQPVFNFYETTDFDSFMREAKRRGYNLDKYSR